MTVMTGWRRATPTLLLKPAHSLCYELKVTHVKVHMRMMRIHVHTYEHASVNVGKMHPAASLRFSKHQ